MLFRIFLALVVIGLVVAADQITNGGRLTDVTFAFVRYSLGKLGL